MPQTSYQFNLTITLKETIFRGSLLTLIRQKTNLRRHFLDKHVDDGVHYHCPHCNRTYRSRNSFTSHISATHKDWKKADINKFAVQKPE